MLDDRILDRARRLIEAEFAERRKVLPDKINRILRKMQIAGMAYSGIEANSVRAACDEEIYTRAEIVWDSLRTAHEAVGSPVSETLATDLKQEVSVHIEKIVKEVSELMARRLSSMKPSARILDLGGTKLEVKEKIDVKVDLYVDSLAKQPAETEQKKKGIIRKILKWFVGIIGAIIVGIIVTVITDILGDFGWIERIKTIVHNILTHK